MLLILTHENADFDAVASQLAAHKLYPEGTPVLSRRINRNVYQFLTLYWDALPFVRAEDWQRRRVDRVILVDTQAPPGVRGLRRDTAIQVIDHHTQAESSQGWTRHIEPVGATVTLLAEMLEQAGLALTAVEASLLTLGIHEDTGSLTYDTTTPRDSRAAAWLLEQGAQLPIVRRFLDVPLSEAQRELYSRLQANSEWLEVEGHSFLIATAVAPAGFDEEISAVAHRLRDALSPAGMIVLVQLAQHVQLVARSTTDFVDVAALAREFGGGGHSRAAAATVLDLSLTQAHLRLLALLPNAVRPMATVAQIMSYGVQTLSPRTTIAEAAEKMKRFGHEGYPVVDPDNGQLLGLLTRRAVDRAVNHNLGHQHVNHFMKTGVVMVRPSDSIEKVQRLMVEHDWGQIPVVADDSSKIQNPKSKILGIVTRTDVLNQLFQPGRPAGPANVRQLLATSLSPAVWRLVQVVSQAAGELSMPLYFVGGLVRDLLLGSPATDADMVVEGEAITLVRHLQAHYGGEVRSHARFGTAKWLLTQGVWSAVAPNTPLNDLPPAIDFVTARTEFYASPSALPEVERSSIKLDLHRRDFTINTLAVRLDGAHLGDLLDFWGGRRDLEEGVVRVLHSLSFIDDPTRILRAIRLEQRLRFVIEPRTAELMTAALPMLDRASGDRVRHEIELALREAAPIPVMQRLSDLGVMAQIHPGLTWQATMAEAFGRVPTLLADPLWQGVLGGESPAFVYFALWLAPLSPTIDEAVMNRLKVRATT
ncbi:MAG: CBS domain-containing protein, partial [Chloroflexota bacterium]